MEDKPLKSYTIWERNGPFTHIPISTVQAGDLAEARRKAADVGFPTEKGYVVEKAKK